MMIITFIITPSVGIIMNKISAEITLFRFHFFHFSL
jgi:hypothetical protein